jgi:hypothetical protein
MVKNIVAIAQASADKAISYAEILFIFMSPTFVFPTLGCVAEDGWFVFYHNFARKTQERQAVREGAYPQRSVTERNAQYFVEFFREKPTR